MGPNTNPALFKEFGEPNVAALDEEFLRRNLLSGTLEELSDLFAEKDHTSHPVTEPTLFGRLYALSQVQKTENGIAGFYPMNAVDFAARGANIRAKAALPHDEFTDSRGNKYRTRVIQLTMPDEDYAAEIDVFGINFYRPDIDVDELLPEISEKGNGLVVVGAGGGILTKEQPITGKTPILAVLNKVTNDAKLYQVSVSMTSGHLSVTSTGITHESETDTRSTVILPDNTFASIKLLTSSLQNEALVELQNGLAKLKAAKEPGADLSEEERVALATSLRRSID